MSAKRRLKKMQRQRRVASRGAQPPAKSEKIDDSDDSSFFMSMDQVRVAVNGVDGSIAGKLPMSSLIGHIIHNDGLAADRLPPGALSELLSESVCPAHARRGALMLCDGCEAWFRWPVGHGLFIDLQLYHDHGKLQVPESLSSHPEVHGVICDVIAEHYGQNPSIRRALLQRGAKAARALIDQIPIHLFLIED